MVMPAFATSPPAVYSRRHSSDGPDDHEVMNAGSSGGSDGVDVGDGATLATTKSGVPSAAVAGVGRLDAGTADPGGMVDDGGCRGAAKCSSLALTGCTAAFVAPGIRADR